VFKYRSLGPVPPVFPVKKQDEIVTLQVVPDGEKMQIAPIVPGSDPSLNKQSEKLIIPERVFGSIVLYALVAELATKSHFEIDIVFPEGRPCKYVAPA
jgi:hypothetical protein